MLTADLVKLRRRRANGPVGAQVELVPLGGEDADAVTAMAAPFIEAARALEGAPRAELVEALDALAQGLADVRMGRALKKLVLDACAFGDDDIDSAALRAQTFALAALRRRDAGFDRAAVLAEIAAANEMEPAALELALFSDLKDAQRADTRALPAATGLVEHMRLRELQAVLLRAERLRVTVRGAPAGLRGLLGAIKFLQLLFEVNTSADGLVLDIEGPMALFQQSTRYGLKMALLVPHVLGCAAAEIEATVRLRKHGPPEQFVFVHQGIGEAPPATLPPHVEALRESLARLGRFEVRVSDTLVHLPGAGAFAPDLVVERKDTGERVFIEVLGFWSREAVWRRVEMVERGLTDRVLFCASERLRVSEAALPADGPAGLLVFKGAIPAQRVVERLDKLTRVGRVEAHEDRSPPK